ncbi:MAG: peptidoglycan-associated lipoprotein Pal [Burkholderiaceae bacterium]|jgi:peptidoglycan-associated lipoprotein|nr:peptidoglycan-associated lipoprotein Pal [Burkholderiaceae bacterium]
MTLFRTPFVVGAAGAALLLGACATPSPVKTGAATATTPAVAAAAAPAPATAATPAAPAAAGESKVASVELPATRAAADAAAGKARPYVYFDFDSAVIRDEFSASIDAHARQLLAAPDKRLRIEGHTDERGGREYNLALGQRRAQAVAQSLQLLGVPDSRLEVVSYGAERPKAEGSHEEAWAQNRRAALRSQAGDRLAQAATPR